MPASRSALAFGLLALATAAALLFVPDWPHRHLDDPAYWGVIGYLAILPFLWGARHQTFGPATRNRQLILLFLLALQVVYVAGWLRFGGSPTELVVQLAGLALWIGIAALARRADLVLWLGCAAHAAWDGFHHGRIDFIPGWYALACLVIDLGMGLFVWLRLRDAENR